MATLPDRLDTLAKAMRSLAGQVDTIQVVLNNVTPNQLFRHFNPFLPYIDYNTFMGKSLTVIEHNNALRDGSRFIGADKKPGYCFVCDDDIEYPPDFVEKMISVYEANPKIGFLAPMGKKLKPRPLKSYYKGWDENYGAFSEVKELTRVDIPGCCGILWHTDRIGCAPAKLNEMVMKVPNSDVCVGVYAHVWNFSCYVIPHAADWLKNLMPELPKGTLDIYKQYRNNDKVQTDYINKWIK